MNVEPDTHRPGGAAQQVAMAFSAALRTASYYDAGNVVLQQATSELKRLLGEMGDAMGAVTLGAHSHCVFVNKARVANSVSTYERFASLMQVFEEWSVTTLTFEPGVTEVELQAVLTLLSRTRPADNEDLTQLLSEQHISKVHAESIEPGTGRKSQAATFLLAYSAAMQLGSKLSETPGAIEPSTMRRARHITQKVVDEILRDSTSLLTLTTIKDFDRYLILHSTNVAVLSTLLGRRLGMDKAMLGELCLAGFLHDAGKLGVDAEVLNKPGRLDAAEWESIRLHPVIAANALLGGQRLTSSAMRTVLVAFEHHLNYDLSGYPPVRIKKSVSLFGGIVSLADRFDALTTARVYREVNLTPPEAMVILMKGSGTDFDPMLVKLFVEVMGLYPTGTVVVLGSGEAGVVCCPPPVGAPLDRPQVRVIVGGQRGTVVDLQEQVGGRYVRSIIGVLNPSNRGQIPAVDPSSLNDAL
jgi:HD-GYP domain-containing protein (c-di-GMP phosphodiesterase class II)